MKTIVFYQNKGTNDMIFDDSVRDNCNDPFIYLKEQLNTRGYDVVLANEDTVLPKCEAVLFFTPPPILLYGGIKGKIRWIKHQLLGRKKFLSKTQFYDSCIKNGLKARMVLVLWEGQSVCPSNYSPYLYSKFSRILTWNDSLVDNKKFFKFYLPIARQESIQEVIPFERKKLLVNISINKLSSFKRELYSARKQSIAYFDKHYPQDFDLYGYGWNLPSGQKMFDTYRGPIKSKQEVLSQYKFSLAYENLCGEPGYITEKIFDCIRAGTVPIYWGASNVDEYVVPSAFIDRRKFKCDEELVQFILKISEAEYDKYIESGREYLKSGQFKFFLPQNFADTFIKVLNLS